MIAHHIETINSNEKIREIFEIQNIFIFRRIANENDNFNIFRFMTKREFRMKIEFQQFRAKTRVARAKKKIVKKISKLRNFKMTLTTRRRKSNANLNSSNSRKCEFIKIKMKMNINVDLKK